MRRILALVLGVLVLTGQAGQSETYYVAPKGAVVADAPDGSQEQPFASVNLALKSGKIKAGDTLLLKDGEHGELEIKANANFDSPVTIMSENGRKAQLDKIQVAQGMRNLTFRNLSVWPSNPDAGATYLVRSYVGSSDITIDRLIVRSEARADKFMDWNAAKWESRKYSGIFLQGDRSTVTRNALSGVNHGIIIGGDNGKIWRNSVNGFNGDGLRATGNNTVVSYNRVMNSVKTNNNHDDGFQSFQTDSTSITGLVLDGNVFIEWTGDPGHALRGKLQGIGMFDGFYDDLLITNNLVVTSHFHGITIVGLRRATITNNTVANANGQSVVYPYIAIKNHRDGTPPSDVLMANNVAMSFQGLANAAKNVVFVDNSVIGTPSLKFANPMAFDYRPKPNSGFIDTANVDAAPKLDMMAQKRPGGAKPDRGAYETQVDQVSPSTAVVLSEDPLAGGEGVATASTPQTAAGSKWIKIPGQPKPTP